MNDEAIVGLLGLSHALGDPAKEWAILGEGNTSTVLDEDSFLVKASGSQMATLSAKQVAAVRFAPILKALEGEQEFSDAQTKDLLLSSCIGAGSSGTGRRMPSVETLLHAYLLTLPGVEFVGHTHVTSINGVLCSAAGWAVMERGERLFPDEIVVCGVAPCCVPYVDPGLPLARTLRLRVEEFVSQQGCIPKTIYLRNHGFIALGGSASEVVRITLMADKAARVLTAAFACGQPTFLTPENIARIASRPDEHFRQKALSQI